MDEQSEKPYCHARPDTDELSLLDYWQVIWKGKALIILIVMITVFSTGILLLFMPNIYQATAIITPVDNTEKEGKISSMLAQQFGQQFGSILPNSSSASEIVNLLNSNIVREKVIQNYNLLPLLFHERWDEERKVWKEESFLWLKKFLRSSDGEDTKRGGRKESSNPEIWDALRELQEIVTVKNNLKENMISISAEFWNPEMAAKIVKYLIATLNDHMCSEAKRVATVNMKYLMDQVSKNPDPYIKQKIYALIAHQIETSMMAEVKENFAFKVIDPPKEPDRKVKPKRALQVMLAFVVSLFLGIFVVFSKEHFKRIKAGA
jgi:uncharacterized protein involved in exopolysaccharide biosynthesis